MKLGVLSFVFGEKSWKDACADIKKAGLDAVEVGCGGFVGKAHCDPAVLMKDDKKLKEWIDAFF